MVGAGSVVLKDVPPASTVVGIPGVVVRQKGKRVLSGVSLNHQDLPDPVQEQIGQLEKEVEEHIKRWLNRVLEDYKSSERQQVHHSSK
jgi:serine O-acetyltransferase